MTSKTLETVDKYAWWSALNHGGLLIAPAKLGEFFVEELTTLPRYQIDRLRRDLDLFAPGDANSLGALLDTVLEGILGLSGSNWQKGNQVEPVWSQKLITGEVLKPRRVWQGYHGSVLPVFTTDGTRLGIGKGRRAVSRVIEWLRRADQKIAVLTNGKQWRLIHAGSDYDAWCETDSSLWFEEGQLGLQITAWRSLLSTKTLNPTKKGELSPLLAAISASRQGQADLSEHLGERVRLAVELLIQETLTRQEDLGIDPQSLYLAATRMVMRCVFILFAEARNLLPRDNAIYNQSYSLQGLREQLDRVSGGRASEALRNRWSAYPRLLALFSLVYHGCSHEALPIPQYGGGLFKPGNADSSDRVLQALALFEKPQEEQLPCDEVVYKILELLTRSPVKVRQGKKAVWVTAPVNFSDLESEYIGILYEGLLDFELRQADPENPMIFLNLGNQPVLPLSRLEEMDDKTLESLVEKLKKQAKSSTTGEESEESEEEEIIDEGLEEEEDLAEEEITDLEPELLSQDDQVADLRARAHQWAIKAVKVGKLVIKPKGKKPDALAKYEAEVSQLAKRLIARIILPGEWFLVRWGGTRKGSGTFYTPPQLAIPTVRRTLEPLVYQQTSPPSKGDLGELKLKSPGEILALKICDPACGSASFPVAALRYLTEALWDSLFTHAWLIEDNQKSLIRVGIPKDAQPAWFVQVVEDLPLTAEKAEEISKAKLRRYVVENCIYGVDINPLAVELGRLALWVETMDKSLPFTFLDHKIKCGNALVGCWFDRFQDYPVMAWEREGGDKNHRKFVHHFREAVNKQKKVVTSGDKWTQAIKDLRNGEVKNELKGLLETLDPSKPSLQYPNFDLPQLPEAIHDQALAVFEEIHAQVNDPNQQEAAYRTEIAESEALTRLKFAFDLWCSVWFWEGDDLDFAPTPDRFFNPPIETRQIVERLSQKYQFFHWELDFPDVFQTNNSGFDCIIGNPPWETVQPNSMEFFSNIDPLYRTYGKQDAIKKQIEYFEHNPIIERDWIAYNFQLKAFANWMKNAGFPWGDPEDKRGHQQQKSDKFSLSRASNESNYLHELWHNRRIKNKSYADPNHPFILQGEGKPYTYKMFLELSLSLLTEGGRLGLIVPSGVYTDKGATTLRTEFLEFNQWDWIFGIINWNKIFSSVYYRFKFCITIIQKGGVTSEIKSAFSRYHIEEWENAEKYIIPYSKEQVQKFSPKSKSLLETRTTQDLDILEKIYSNSILLGDDSPYGWSIQYSQGDFNMTSDSKLFPPRPQWEAQGSIADEYGYWLKGNWQVLGENQESWQEILNRPEGVILSRDQTQFIYIDDIEDIALPLYEGRMIGQFDFSEKGWVSGKGRSAEWRDIPFENKVVEPQYCIALKNASIRKKVSFMDIASSTNMRTMVASINYFPCGNSSPILETKKSVNLLISILNTITYDYVARSRCGGLHLNYFVIEETALLNINLINKIIRDKIEFLSSQIILISPAFSRDWLALKNISNTFNEYITKTWESLWSITPYERLRLRCILDAIIAELYGLEIEDFAWMLQKCDHSIETMRDKAFYRTLDPKGFWRVDKEQDPELRHTVLSLVAFHELKKIGLDNFLNLNDGEGWMLPDTLRLADYGLGHDDRAKQPQPVTSRFTLTEWDNLETPLNTPINYRQRFYPWQLAKTPEQSWAECERHAENLRLLLKQNPPLEPTPAKSAKLPSDPDYQPPTNLLGEPLQVNLFGEIVDDNPKKRR